MFNSFDTEILDGHMYIIYKKKNKFCFKITVKLILDGINKDVSGNKYK